MTIILYFSRKGENLIDGQIKVLVKGNTKALAEKISRKLNVPVFEIAPVDNYPYSYQETLKIVESEKNEHVQPEYKPLKIDLDTIDTLFLGFPNWCGSMPKIVRHFLEQTDLSNKKIYPFCTHEGSTFGNSLIELKKICPNSIIQLGLPVRGSRVENADTAISNWLFQYQSNGGNIYDQI